MQTDEKTFDQAVHLAAAFVANGDLRLAGGSTDEGQNSMAQLGDLIRTLCIVLAEQRSNLVQPARTP